MSANSEENDSESQQIIQKTLKDCFGEEIAKKFADESIDYKEAVEDLLRKEADARIFEKLGLSYGKAIKFKKEFSKLYPVTYKTYGAKTNKPSMGQLESCSAEIKRLYLTKRKQVGMLASAHWTGQPFPKFNTATKKQRLMEFAESIEEKCGVPEVGFGKDGIAEHIQSYFSEQRRYQKRTTSSSDSSSESSQQSSNMQEPKDLDNSADANVQHKDSSIEDDEDMDETQDSESTNTTVLYSEDEEDIQTTNEVQPVFSKAFCSKVLKGVFSKVPERAEAVKVLTGKFKMSSKNLSQLNYIQLMEVLSRKLINARYVKLNGDSQVSVLKEIDLE